MIYSLLAAFFEKEFCKIGSQRSLRADVCTRWNSNLHMIEGFLVSNTVICTLFAEKHSLNLIRTQPIKLRCLELTSSDWNSLKNLSRILTPFDLATKRLSGRRYVTVRLYLFAIHHLKVFLDDTLRVIMN